VANECSLLLYLKVPLTSRVNILLQTKLKRSDRLPFMSSIVLCVYPQHIVYCALFLYLCILFFHSVCSVSLSVFGSLYVSVYKYFLSMFTFTLYGSCCVT